MRPRLNGDITKKQYDWLIRQAKDFSDYPVSGIRAGYVSKREDNAGTQERPQAYTETSNTNWTDEDILEVASQFNRNLKEI